MRRCTESNEKLAGSKTASGIDIRCQAWAGYGEAFFLHQLFQQRHGLREGICATAIATRAAGGIERRATVGIFGGQVGAVRYQEFDVLVEAVFSRAVQGGLVRHRIRARHLTAATESCRDAG